MRGNVRARQLGHLVAQNNLRWCPDLLLAIREADEVIHLQKEIVVAGLFKWWGSIPCDPILTEKTPAHLQPYYGGLLGHFSKKPFSVPLSHRSRL
jgi:hypothetical protein